MSVTGCKTGCVGLLMCISGNKTAQVLPQSGALGSAALEFPIGGKPGSGEATIRVVFFFF